MKRQNPRALLLDMDGVLYHGERLLVGADTLLRRLDGCEYAFVTNNPIRTPEEIADFLVDVGLPRPAPGRILTSALATARWIHQVHPGFRYFAVGAGGLDAALSAYGQADAVNADFVVVGEGVGLDYDNLATGINLILERGARLVATNPDPTVDSVRDGQHLLLPGCGALVAPFTAATRVTPTIVGKPEPLLYEMALEQLGCSAGECLMVGDRPDTDIAGAQRMGMWTALVRTGRFAPGCHWNEDTPKPDFDVLDLPSLMQALDVAFPNWLGSSGPGAPVSL